MVQKEADIIMTDGYIRAYCWELRAANSARQLHSDSTYFGRGSEDVSSIFIYVSNVDSQSSKFQMFRHLAFI